MLSLCLYHERRKWENLLWTLPTTVHTNLILSYVWCLQPWNINHKPSFYVNSLISVQKILSADIVLVQWPLLYKTTQQETTWRINLSQITNFYNTVLPRFYAVHLTAGTDIPRGGGGGGAFFGILVNYQQKSAYNLSINRRKKKNFVLIHCMHWHHCFNCLVTPPALLHHFHLSKWVVP